MIGLSELDTLRHFVDMSRSEFLAASGAAFGFLGGLLLAFTGHGELRAHRLAIHALQAEVHAIISRGVSLYITGTEKHIERGERLKKSLTWLGVIFLASSLFLTLLAFFVGDAAC
jgi:hypothetical protein